MHSWRRAAERRPRWPEQGPGGPAGDAAVPGLDRGPSTTRLRKGGPGGLWRDIHARWLARGEAGRKERPDRAGD